MIAPRTPWSCVLPADACTDLNTGIGVGMGTDMAPIIAAVSFGHAGSQCLRQACQRAAHTGQPVIALHVVHETGRTAGLYHRHDTSPGLTPIADIAKQMLAEQVADCVGGEPACQALEIRKLAVAGLPGRRISEIAELTGADLIVIGYRPKRGLARLLSSSVTQTVLRHAPCAVLVVDEAGNPVDAQQRLPRHRGRSHASALQTG